MTKDEADIRRILDDRAKALYARNSDQLLASSTADSFSFDLDPPLQHKGNKADAKAGLEAWFATWKGPIGWENRDVTVFADGNIAFSTALSRISGTKTDGEEISLWFRNTNGYRKENGAWKLVHLHSSVPYAMDGSNKACVDLKP
ncbi:MAG TPA: nuclear transport factor 2 family protein [Rhizomicrobium sp.]